MAVIKQTSSGCEEEAIVLAAADGCATLPTAPTNEASTAPAMSGRRAVDDGVLRSGCALDAKERVSARPTTGERNTAVVKGCERYAHVLVSCVRRSSGIDEKSGQLFWGTKIV